MRTLRQSCQAWLAGATTKVKAGTLGPSDLNALRKLLDDVFSSECPDNLRQCLLYLHANEPSIHAKVVAMAEHEPKPHARDLVGQRADWPYATVHDAILDGWQVIHFPNQLAPFDDREVDIVGYEFICQKWRHIDDGFGSSAG